MITITKHLPKIICLAAKKIQATIMEEKDMEINILISNLLITNSKTLGRTILTITQINHHHIHSKIILVILET